VLAVAGGAALALAPAPDARADSIRDRQYWLDEFGIRDAWQVTRGAGVTIAVIDSGVDAAHPDLTGAVVGGADVSGRGAPDGTRPVSGTGGAEHGTLVASLAAGRGSGPTSGVIGAAPAASLLSVSLAFGTGERSADAQVAEAVRWAVDNGADIISLSLTRNTLGWPESWDSAFGYAEENDVVVVAAAGNRGSGTEAVGAPATMPGVLAVGGVDRSGVASDNASSQGITIGVMAPSEQLVGAVPGGGHALWQGTSGATPIVAGIAALVRAAHPDLDAANVIERILRTARPATPTVPDPLYGYGLIDARAAVSASVAPVASNPLGSLAEWVVVHRRADADTVTADLPEARDPIARGSVTRDPVADARPAIAAAAPVLPVVGLLLGVVLTVVGAATAGAVQFARRERSE
jgi:subtilisin family serine protease